MGKLTKSCSSGTGMPSCRQRGVASKRAVSAILKGDTKTFGRNASYFKKSFVRDIKNGSIKNKL